MDSVKLKVEVGDHSETLVVRANTHGEALHSGQVAMATRRVIGRHLLEGGDGEGTVTYRVEYSTDISPPTWGILNEVEFTLDY